MPIRTTYTLTDPRIDGVSGEVSIPVSDLPIARAIVSVDNERTKKIRAVKALRYALPSLRGLKDACIAYEAIWHEYNNQGLPRQTD